MRKKTWRERNFLVKFFSISIILYCHDVVTDKINKYMNEQINELEVTMTNACVCVGDVYKHKHGVFNVRSIEGSNLCYIDSIQFDGNGNVVIWENIIFYIDDFDTFEELEHVNSDTFQEIMFNAKAYVEATHIEEKSKQMLNDLFENLKGFRI